MLSEGGTEGCEMERAAHRVEVRGLSGLPECSVLSTVLLKGQPVYDDK